MKFDYYTISHSRYGDGADVFGWTTYERSSVLAGQPQKVFIDAFPTIEDAQAEYPNANISSHWTEPQVSLSHLPGDDDFVPGGAYPDDY
jgi:hypothetical protein